MPAQLAAEAKGQSHAAGCKLGKALAELQCAQGAEAAPVLTSSTFSQVWKMGWANSWMAVIMCTAICVGRGAEGQGRIRYA